MAETLDTLVLKMQAWLSANSTRLPDAVAIDTINLVQRELCRKHDLRWMETSDTFVTVAGTPTYDVPTGWSRPYRLWYVDPDDSAIIELENISKETFDRRYPDATKTAKPSDYTIWGGALYLGKTPDQILTIHREYYKLLDDLATGSPTNTNEFIANDWEVLFWGALAHAESFMFEDPRIPLWKEQYHRAESDLVAEHRRAWSSGRIAQSRIPG